jgi:hypothetical protein
MSQNPDERRDDLPEGAEHQVPAAPAPAADEPQALEPAAGETQVMEPATGETQVVEPAPARPEDLLSIFDEPSPADTGTAQPTTTATDAGATAPLPPYTPADQAGYRSQYQTAYEPVSPPTPAPPAAAAPVWTPPPAPLVRTTPRVGTIVWGFVIVAIGIGALSVSAGARLDVGLALIYLLAVAGGVLIVASVVSAARRRSRSEAIGA